MKDAQNNVVFINTFGTGQHIHTLFAFVNVFPGDVYIHFSLLNVLRDIYVCFYLKITLVRYLKTWS